MILNVLNTPLGQLATQIVLLTGLYWGGTGLIKAMNLGANALKLFAGGLTTASTAAEVFGAALKSALGIIGLIIIAVQAAAAIYDHFNVTLEEQREIVDELRGEVNSLQSEYDELLDKSRSDEGLVEAEQTRLNLLKQQLEIKKQILAMEEQEEFEMDTSEGGDSSLSLGQASVVSYESLASSLEWYEEKLEALGPITEANAEQAEKWAEKIENTQAAMLEHLGVVNDSVVALQEWEEKGYDLPPAAQELIDAYHDLVENAGEYGIAIEESSDKTEEAAKGFDTASVSLTNFQQAAQSIPDGLQKIAEDYQSLKEIQDSYNQTGELTAGQLATLTSLASTYSNAISVENGVLTVNAEALYDSAAQARQKAIEDAKLTAAQQLQQIALEGTAEALESTGDSALDAYDPLNIYKTKLDEVAGSAISAAGAVNALDVAMSNDPMFTGLTQEQEAAMQAVFTNYKNFVALVNQTNIDYGDLLKPSSGGTSSSTTTAQTAEEQYAETLKTQSDTFSKLNELTEDNIYFKEKEGASTEELIALYRDYLDQLKQQEEWFRSQGEGDESEYVRDLKRQQIDLQDTITQLQQDAFDDRLQISEDYMDERNELDDWGADNEIAALQRVLDWMDEWYDKGLIDYEYYWDKRVDIARRKAQAEKEAWEESLNAQIEAYEKQQDAYETLFSIVTDNIQKEIDALEERKSDIEESYQQQIDDLQQVNDELEDQIANEEALDALARARQSKVMVYKDGRFQYINDIDQVSEAQANLEKLERDQILEEEVKKLEELRDRELESIDEQIEGWEEYKKEWESVVDDYQEEQDRLLVLQELGIDLEGDNWKLRLDNLQSYISQYKALMAELANAQELLNQGYQGGNIEISTPGVGITPGTGSLAGTQNNAWANVSGTGFAGVTVGSNGQPEQWGLPAGTIIYTDNGAYKITGGGKYNGDPYDMEYVGKTPSNIWTPSKGGGTSSSGGSSGGVGGSSSGGKGSSSGGSSSGGNKYQGSASGGNNIKDSYDINSPAGQEFVDTAKPGDELDGGDGSHWVKNENGTITITRGDDEWTVPAHAMGTLGARGGFSLVGEKGPELRVLNSGDGVIPADVTKNLWGWGSINPGNFFGNILDKITGGTNVTISSLTLPNVHDPEGFIEYFNSAMWRRTLQFQTS